MNPLIKELVNDIDNIMQQSNGQPDDYVHKARGILLLLKKLKINKISEIQYKYNDWFNDQVSNYKSGKYGEGTIPHYNWPIQFIPEIYNINKDNKKLMFTMNLVENWWADNDYYEHLKIYIKYFLDFQINILKIFSKIIGQKENWLLIMNKKHNIDDITQKFSHNVEFKAEVLNTIKVIEEAIKIKLRDFDNGSFILFPIYHVKKQMI